MKKPFTSLGGKGQTARRIISIFSNHTTYIEPYAGGAAVYWNKLPVQFELLNDMEPDLVSTLRFLKEITQEEIDAFCEMDWVGSEETFAQSIEKHTAPIWIAWAFMYRRKFSFRSRETHFTRALEGVKLNVSIEGLQQWKTRLSNTTIWQRDGVRVISIMDRSDTVMFVDPPWPKYGSTDVWQAWTESSFRPLAEVLFRCRNAAWFYFEDPQILKIVPTLKRFVRGTIGSDVVLSNQNICV